MFGFGGSFAERMFCGHVSGKRYGNSSAPGDICMPSALWKLYSGLRRLALQEEGQDLVEYSLTILLVVIAAVASAGGVASKILAMYSYINANYP